MQADQSVYLYPRRAHLPGPAAMVVGENDFPDVVLEVDYSTDVRRGKLGLYESWGFPEVWVEVPDRRAPSRPRGRMAGLTIHVLEAGAYRVSGESRAFPGWTAQDIHAALNETTPSARTYAVVERVGTELGAREGTGPEDDPLLHSQRRQSRAEGIGKVVRRASARAWSTNESCCVAKWRQCDSAPTPPSACRGCWTESRTRTGSPRQASGSCVATVGVNC